MTAPLFDFSEGHPPIADLEQEGDAQLARAVLLPIIRATPGINGRDVAHKANDWSTKTRTKRVLKEMTRTGQITAVACDVLGRKDFTYTAAS